MPALASLHELQSACPLALLWTAQGTWTPGVAALVQANAAGASLQQLALDITGDAADAALAYPNMGPILKGELIDVTPLLTFLQQTVNNNILSATESPNIKISAKFGFGGAPGWNVIHLGETGLNMLFNATAANWPWNPVEYQCFVMAEVFWARGVQEALQPGEFDLLFQNVDNMHNTLVLPKNNVPLDQLLPGDWTDFLNAPDCPVRGWQNENVLVLGGGQYLGWGIGVGDYTSMKQSLFNTYNDAVKQTGIGWQLWLLSSVPGYHNQAWTINYAKLGQMVFNLRTGQQ